MDQLEYSLEKVQDERLVFRGEVAPAVRCRKRWMQEECETLQLGNLERNLTKHGLPKAVRTKCVGTIGEAVASFAPLSIDYVNQRNDSYYRRGHHYNYDTHQTCSWVPDLKLLVSDLMSEEGLKLEDIPSSMRALS